ncbi:hypothetical protein, partial [Polaribacter sejongensis]|uniref:hypothetical protein n=1 Tax=Polaribacter sejongensis TaxID=985043 RepID=UPI001AD82C6C
DKSTNPNYMNREFFRLIENKLIININLKIIKVKSIFYSLILLDIIRGLTVNINRVDIDFWL